MDELHRRNVLALAAGAGILSAFAAADGAEPEAKKPLATDRDRVIAAGMTEAEADCWELIAQAAGKFFELPQLHPMDKQEVANAIHIVQNKLLSRPTYRRYLELAKQAGKK